VQLFAALDSLSVPVRGLSYFDCYNTGILPSRSLIGYSQISRLA